MCMYIYIYIYIVDQDWFTEQLELIGENIKKDVESFLIEMKVFQKNTSLYIGNLKEKELF